MDRFRYYILFLVLHAHLSNSIVIQVKPHAREKELYLSVSNADLKKTHVDAEQILNLRPTKINSLSKQNGPFFENQRIFKTANSTKHVTASVPRGVVRRAPPPYAYNIHQSSGAKPIYEIDTESTLGLPENHHSGYSYDPPSITHDLSNTYELQNLKGSCTPEEIVAAIEKLDRLLKPIVNSDSYNSSVHPPPNPVLALILSRYGRYLSGSQYSNAYSYMAVNNIHNSKPFGQYKYE